MTPEELTRLERLENNVNGLHERLLLLEQRPTAPPDPVTSSSPSDLEARVTALESALGGTV